MWIGKSKLWYSVLYNSKVVWDEIKCELSDFRAYLAQHPKYIKYPFIKLRA